MWKCVENTKCGKCVENVECGNVECAKCGMWKIYKRERYLRNTKHGFLSRYRNTSGNLRERDAVGTLIRFFEFSQTFTSVSITREKHGVHVFYFF